MSVLPGLLTENLYLKLAALGLAILLWTVVRADAPVRATVRDVPIQVVVDDPDWALVGEPDPETATLVFTGSARELLRLLGERPRIVLAADEIGDPSVVRELTADMVRVGGGVERSRIAEIRPSRVRLRFEPIRSDLRPVAVRVRGELPVGVRLESPIRAEPGAVRVSGARSRIAALDSVPLVAIDLGAFSSPDTLRVAVDSTALDRLLVAPAQVRVIVPAVNVADSLAADSLRADSLRLDSLPGGTPGLRPTDADTSPPDRTDDPL